MRLFVAVEIPPALHAPLLDVAARVGTAGWRRSPPEQLHLTVRFLGAIGDVAIADSAIDDVRARLAHVASRCAPFSIDIDGAGTFGKKRAPHVLWAGVQSSPSDAAMIASLDALARSVDDALDPLLGPRDRPFRAHVTLGRAREGARVDDEAMRKVGVIGRVSVEELVLFNSVTHGSSQGSEGSAAVHTAVDRWRLTGGLQQARG